MTTKSIYRSPAGEMKIMALYAAVLARWPVEHETFKLPTRQGNTFIIASGEKSAPPLVLLHGAASNAVSWVGDVAAYCRHFRVVAVDLPGEPGKSSQNRPAWEGPGYRTPSLLPHSFSFFEPNFPHNLPKNNPKLPI